MAKKIIIDGQEICDRRRKNNNSYKITWGAILLLGTIIGYLFLNKTSAENRIAKIEESYGEVKEDISAIRTDIQWIKDVLKEMRRR